MIANPVPARNSPELHWISEECPSHRATVSVVVDIAILPVGHDVRGVRPSPSLDTRRKQPPVAHIACRGNEPLVEDVESVAGAVVTGEIDDPAVHILRHVPDQTVAMTEREDGIRNGTVNRVVERRVDRSGGILLNNGPLDRVDENFPLAGGVALQLQESILADPRTNSIRHIASDHVAKIEHLTGCHVTGIEAVGSSRLEQLPQFRALDLVTRKHVGESLVSAQSVRPFRIRLRDNDRLGNRHFLHATGRPRRQHNKGCAHHSP